MNSERSSILPTPEEQEVFLTEAERIRIIKAQLDEMVALYDREDLSGNQRHHKYRINLGEIKFHLRANPELFHEIERVFLSVLESNDNSLLSISFHAAALGGILEERTRDNEIWEQSFYKGKLKLLENLDQAIGFYTADPSFTNLMMIIDIVSGYHFVRSNQTRESDEQLLLLTKGIYNATANLCVNGSVNLIITFLKGIQIKIAPDIERLRMLFRP